MEERSSIDLQRFYPESLQIIKISEETEQIKLMKLTHNTIGRYAG